MTKHRFSKWVYHRKLLIHEFWKDASHKSKALGLLLTDLLQAFDFFFCEPLNFISLEFVSGSFIKSKLDSFFSFRENILSGVLQGYISWIYFYSTMKRLGRGGGRGGEGQFDCLPFGFNKNMFFRERMKLWFFATFSTCSENLKIL